MLSSRILIYSDDSSVANPLIRVARKLHISVTHVDTFQELLKKINKRFLAVFIDYKTLNALEGEVNKLNGLSNETFLVAITSSRRMDEDYDYLNERIFDILRRPMDHKEVKRVLERLLYIKHIVRNITKNMIELEDNSVKNNSTLNGNIESMSMGKLVEVKLRKVMEKVNLNNIKGFYNIIVEEIEKPLLQVVLESVNGNQIKASKILGINRNTLSKKLRQYNIKK